MLHDLRLAFVLFLLASCSGNATDLSSAGTDDAGASLDGLRAAFCKAVRSCCAAAGSPAEPLADCESEFDRQLPLVALVTKGTLVADRAKLGACIARLDEQSRTCVPTDYACGSVFSGTLAEGAACERADECSRSAGQSIACVKTSVTADSGPKSGVCRVIPIGKRGDACAQSCSTGNSCSSTISTFESDPVLTLCREDDGLYCDSTRHCAALVADGAPCSDSGCASASHCSGVCTPRKAEGGTCASFAECRAGLGCANGSCAATPFATAKLCRGDYN
jgi:hypothetical protein